MKNQIKIRNMTHSASYNFYTDASKIESNEKTGFSIYLINNSTKKPGYFIYSCKSSLSVYQAELLAIRFAIKIANKISLRYRSNIFSDCLSAVSVIKKENHMNISITHVPAHVGIYGNELADLLAKIGTSPHDPNWENIKKKITSLPFSPIGNENKKLKNFDTDWIDYIED